MENIQFVEIFTNVAALQIAHIGGSLGVTVKVLLFIFSLV